MGPARSSIAVLIVLVFHSASASASSDLQRDVEALSGMLHSLNAARFALVPRDHCASSSAAGDIINGIEAAEDEFPAVLMLKVGSHYCTGTVIRSPEGHTLIQTAAHCLMGAYASVPELLANSTEQTGFSSAMIPSAYATPRASTRDENPTAVLLKEKPERFELTQVFFDRGLMEYLQSVQEGAAPDPDVLGVADVVYFPVNSEIAGRYGAMELVNEPPSVGDQVTQVGFGGNALDVKGQEVGFGIKRYGTNEVTSREGGLIVTRGRLYPRVPAGIGSSLAAGDSGGPLISGGRVAGVASIILRDGVERVSYFTDLSTPQLRRFLQQIDSHLDNTSRR